MALQIGRVGLGIALENPGVWDHDGNIVTVTGELFAANIYDAKALRQQLLGHLDNPDESIIPVIWSEDSWVDGFYRVLDVSVGSVTGSLFAFWFPFSATLHRVSDYAAPLIESVLLAPATIRDNDHSIANSRVYHSLPVTATQRSLNLGSPTTTPPAEEADMDTIKAATDFADEVTDELIDGTETYLLPPADWYDGGCRIELDYADTGVFRPVVGRQIINLPGEGRWRISNGIIRITLEDAADFIFGISRWLTGSPGSWTTPTEFFIGTSATNRVPYDAPETITILRNSVEQSVVRFYAKYPAGTFTIPYLITLILNRGAAWVEVQITSAAAGVGTLLEIGRNQDQAGSVLSNIEPGLNAAGIKATAADGNGLKYFLATPHTINTTDTTQGILYMASFAYGTVAAAAVGLVLDAGAATDAPERPEGAALNFLAAQYETVRVVER